MSHSKFKELYFPMLKLPFPIIERAIRKLSASDVFHFSLISPEHLECVRLTTGHALSGAEIKFSVSSPEIIEIEFKTVDFDRFFILVNDMEKATSICENKDYVHEIDGIPMKITISNEKWTFAYVPSGLESKIALIKYCFENLQCQGILLYFENYSHQISVYKPIIDIFKQCQDLWIWRTSETQSDDDMEQFLSDIQISRQFYFCGRASQSLELPLSVFNAKRVWIRSSIVITREMLLSMNCEFAHFEQTHLTFKDFRAFVTNWFNSDGTRLKRLIVGKEIPGERRVRREIEIGALKLRKIPAQYIEPMGNGKTKILRADGTFAVVIFNRDLFDFRVSDEEVEFDRF